MPVDRSALAALVDDVNTFYVRDRRMRRAQETMVGLLGRREDPKERAVRTYLDAVRRYFAGFEGEARTRLRDVERRLARASQLQFNLTAERGVALVRVERTQGVLARLAELARQ
jgi:hypothetical protein